MRVRSILAVGICVAASAALPASASANRQCSGWPTETCVGGAGQGGGGYGFGYGGSTVIDWITYSGTTQGGGGNGGSGSGYGSGTHCVITNNNWDCVGGGTP